MSQPMCANTESSLLTSAPPTLVQEFSEILIWIQQVALFSACCAVQRSAAPSPCSSSPPARHSTSLHASLLQSRRGALPAGRACGSSPVTPTRHIRLDKRHHNKSCGEDFGNMQHCGRVKDGCLITFLNILVDFYALEIPKIERLLRLINRSATFYFRGLNATDRSAHQSLSNKAFTTSGILLVQGMSITVGIYVHG
jgi:hypothetical protein